VGSNGRVPRLGGDNFGNKKKNCLGAPRGRRNANLGKGILQRIGGGGTSKGKDGTYAFKNTINPGGGPDGKQMLERIRRVLSPGAQGGIRH